MRKIIALEVRFWGKVKKTDSCWIWQAQLHRQGYGQMRIGGRHGKFILAHRLSWMLFRGEIPDNLKVLHHCDIPACVNPDHLFLGTQADNVHDMYSKGRGPDTGGENNGRAILTKATVLEMRAKFEAGGFTKRALARLYNISYSQSIRILNYQEWL